MNTDELITALAADTPPGRGVWPGVAPALLGPVLLTGAAFVWATGVRPDILAASLAQPTLWKWALPALLAVVGLLLARRLSAPEGVVGRWLTGLLLLALGVAAALWLQRLIALPQEDWGAALRGQTLLICLPSILGIGLPGLVGALALLRRGAPTRPGLAGLAAGLACGGAATVLYAMHCTEDDPLFFVTWYGTAILTLGVVGALLGARLLRW
jgi:hypothetical protein